MIKKIISLICCACICLSLAACGSTDFGSVAFEDVEFTDLPRDSVIAENSNYILEFDKTNAGIILTSKATGEIWKSTPEDPNGPEVDDLGMPIKKHPRVESILAIECKNFVRDELNAYFSYTDAVQLGRSEEHTSELQSR